jgi:hypothetical protein
MIDNIVVQQKAMDVAQAADRRDAAFGTLQTWARSVMPPVAWGALIAVVLGLIALYVWRGSKVSIPDWGRMLFGVKRTLRSRKELGPRPSRYHPGVPR